MEQICMRYNLVSVLLTFLYSIHIVESLYQDQVGKIDWRNQYIGIPNFVLTQPEHPNIIVGTESNVIASLSEKDGSIIWRQLLPKDCSLNQMSIMKSEDHSQGFLIRTSCTSAGKKHSQFWNSQNGLLASQQSFKNMAEDETAESVLAVSWHSADNKKIFTLRDESSLIVDKDGKVSFVTMGKHIWSREESLASLTAVEIFKMPVDMRDKFGLKKMIVAITDVGKVFGIDTMSGAVIWTHFDSDLTTRGTDQSNTLLVSKQSDESALESRAVIINSLGFIVNINPITGDTLEKKKLPGSLRQLALTEIYQESGLRGALMLDTQGGVHIYPDHVASDVQQNLHKYYMTIVERSPTRLQGYRFSVESDKIVPKQIWNLPLKDSEGVVNLGIKRIDEEIHSPARVLGDRGILYKYVNPNLIALMTQSTTGDLCSPDTSINIYLVDGVTGALVHNVHHPRSRSPSKMVHSENWLVYSYYSTKNRRTEVSSLELFEGVIQTNSTAFSSSSRSHIKPKLVEHKTFIFPGGIDAMTDTVTRRGMTNKHIIVALPSGGLLEIPKTFLDPRRPINMLMEHREEGLIPYMPELPVPSESIINYYQTILATRNVVTSPADLESTSLVFAYGLDHYFTRVTPSQPFDVLKEDFDHVLITVALIFLVVASYISKRLAQRKALYAAWK